MYQVLQEREEELRKTATIGKQLLEERDALKLEIKEIQAKLELFEQEKYSLKTDLKIQIQNNESHSVDLEAERQQVDNLYKQLDILKKDNQSMQQRIQNVTKENQEFKKAQDDLQCEVSFLKAKVISQEEQIKVFQDQPGVSLDDSTFDVTSQLENELSSHILKIKNLEHALSQSHLELDCAKVKESQLNKLVFDLKEEVDVKDAKINSCSVEMKNSKEEIADLQTEIELLKVEQVDVNCRGNSVFSELDDRRKFVEKEFKILNKKFQNLVEVYEENQKELLRARGQIAVLSSMTSRDYQQRYIEKLEEDNLEFKEEIRNLTNRLSKMMKNQQEMHHIDQLKFKSDEYDYLRVLLQQSEEKVKSLKNELVNLHMQNICNKDKLSEASHHLYIVNQELEESQKENGMLKLKLQEAQFNPNAISSNFITSSNKPNIEILPRNESPTKSKEVLQTTADECDQNNPFSDINDIIPAEFELGEDGFKMKRPPRKSNISVLREFNRLADDKHKQAHKTSQKVEIVAGAVDPVADTIRKFQVKEQSSVYRCKTYSSNGELKNDRCAQQ